MRKISLLVAMIAAAAILCAACGGGAPAPGSGTHPSPADPNTVPAGTSGSGAGLGLGSSPNTCKLVPLAAARAVLGNSFVVATYQDDFCTYHSDNSNVNQVGIAIFPVAYTTRGQLTLIPEGSSPFNGLGHPAECGPYPTGTSMEAAVGSASTLVIQGPSCSDDAKLAQDVYSALAS